MQENLSIEDLIERARGATGSKSMGALCRAIGASRNCAYNWRTGHRPSLEHTIKMATAAGLSTDDAVRIWNGWK